MTQYSYVLQRDSSGVAFVVSLLVDRSIQTMKERGFIGVLGEVPCQPASKTMVHTQPRTLALTQGPGR